MNLPQANGETERPITRRSWLAATGGALAVCFGSFDRRASRAALGFWQPEEPSRSTSAISGAKSSPLAKPIRGANHPADGTVAEAEGTPHAADDAPEAGSGAGVDVELLRRRVRAMLVGSLLGDAAGGPLEFVPHERIARFAPTVRRWSDEQRLDRARAEQMANAFRLYDYADLRPSTAPYGPWAERAAAGTLTDDSRHKIVMLRAIATAERRGRQVTAKDVARAYLEFAAHCEQMPDPVPRLAREWLAEQLPACRWVLGLRDLDQALPPARLWGGLPTVMGQMVLVPLAAVYAGCPEAAYRAAYRVGFFDNGPAKDLNAALVATLAMLLGRPAHDDRAATEEASHTGGHQPPASPSESGHGQALRSGGGSPLSPGWFAALRDTLRRCDPYRYGQVAWVERPVVRWLRVAEQAADAAEGRPARLFRHVESRVEARTWWEAHVTFTTVLAVAKFCGDCPLAAMQLALDFGHDTDSTAQLLGALVGAAADPPVWPKRLEDVVCRRLKLDYGESLDDWVDLLVRQYRRCSTAGASAAASGTAAQ